MAGSSCTQSKIDARATSALAALASLGQTRSCPSITEQRGTSYKLDGHSVIGFCSNDYLGFAADSVPQATDEASGAGASHLISGRRAVHTQVESQIAQMAGTQDAVLFASAYQANLGLLPLLLRAEDRVYSDRLNHASLIDGIRLSPARATVLPHLASPPTPTPERPSWWITESLFSMDGTRSSAAAMDSFQAAGGMLLLDDAHGFGLGPGGCGHNASLRTPAAVTVIGLGKACGRAGGAVAGSTVLCEWLRSACRSFVFSTAMPPSLTHQVLHALIEIRGDKGEQRRAQLSAHMHTIANALGRKEVSPIVPLWVGDNQRALDWSAALLARGIHVQAIRPPTVPAGGARLRLTLSANHTETQIRDLLTALEQSAKAIEIAWPPRAHAPAAAQGSNPAHRQFTA